MPFSSVKMLVIPQAIIVLLPILVLGLECNKSNWTCSDYAKYFKNDLENALKCLEYDSLESPLNALGKPGQQVVNYGIKTRKIKSLNTDLMVFLTTSDSLERFYKLLLFVCCCCRRPFVKRSVVEPKRRVSMDPS